MSRFTRSGCILLLLGVLGAFGQGASGQEALLDAADAARVEACRRAVLGCQLSDGAIVAVGYREAGRPAFVEPYFANLACLGILAAHEVAPQAADLTFVARWLEWYATHQNPDGTIAPREGVRSSSGTLGQERLLPPDSHDAYAGTFLLVASRQARATRGKLSPAVMTALERSLSLLERCRNANGLTTAFDPAHVPAGKVNAQYLLDNIEVYQGLVEAPSLLRSGDARLSKLAERTEARAAELARAMGQFWSPEQGYFVVMAGDRAAGVRFESLKAGSAGLATASAIALLEGVPGTTQRRLWSRLDESFGNAIGRGFRAARFSEEEPTVERIYLAARRGASAGQQAVILQELKSRLDYLIQRSAQLARPASANAEFPSVHRFGLGIIALLSQTGRPATQLPTVPLVWSH